VLDDVLQQIENSNGHEEDAQKFWQELERLQAMSPVIVLISAQLARVFLRYETKRIFNM